MQIWPISAEEEEENGEIRECDGGGGAAICHVPDGMPLSPPWAEIPLLRRKNCLLNPHSSCRATPADSRKVFIPFIHSAGTTVPDGADVPIKASLQMCLEAGETNET